MPTWSKIAAGLAIAVTLLGVAGLKAYSERLGRIVQTHGTTYYGDAGPKPAILPCKPESEIRGAIARVRAEFDRFEGKSLEAFEDRAAFLKGLPPLRVDTLYVITADDKLRDGELVLFIGLTANCVSTVFSFPARLYQELVAASGAA